MTTEKRENKERRVRTQGKKLWRADALACLRVRQKKCNKLGEGQSLVSDATHMTHAYKSDLKEGAKSSLGTAGRRRRQWLSLKNALIMCEMAAGRLVWRSIGRLLTH